MPDDDNAETTVDTEPQPGVSNDEEGAAPKDEAGNGEGVGKVQANEASHAPRDWDRWITEETERFETERRYMETELARMRNENQHVKNELARLRSPPQVIGHILDVLPDGRATIKSSTGPDFVVQISETLRLAANLLPGDRVALHRQTLSVMNVLPSIKDPLISGAEVIERPTESYADVGGLEEARQELTECVELPLLRPDLFDKVGIEPPKGVLLVGPPGTGKTLLAKAVAHSTNATFIRLIGSELVQKFIGEGARMVRELFTMAQEKAPSILFIDELDAVGAKRIDSGTAGDREVQRTLMQLLGEMDGFKPRGEVRILAACNRPDILDEALLRPGRFDRVVEIPYPDLTGREAILAIHTKQMNLDEAIDLAQVARAAEGASGADLKALCTEAGMFAIRHDRDRVTREDFEAATEKLQEAGGWGAQGEEERLYA